jgi:cold shock CspA family protein
VHHSDIDGEGFRSLAEGARVEYAVTWPVAG